jgi:hypothetical protein
VVKEIVSPVVGSKATAQPGPDESLAISTELGMRPLMVLALPRWDILKA